MVNHCGYFSETSFSNICSFNHEFKTKRVVEGNLSFVEALKAAIYQSKPLSPVSFFNRRNGLFYF